MARQDKHLGILHVEDDENDALLLVKACQQASLPVQIHHAPDADRAKAYLTGEQEFSDRFKYPLPQVIVLDLKLPGIDGFEFLKWLREQKDYSSIPVLVFTSSLATEDKRRATSAGADSFFVKPASFEAWVKLVEVLKPPPEQSN